MAIQRPEKMVGERSEVRGMKGQQSGVKLSMGCWSA